LNPSTHLVLQHGKETTENDDIVVIIKLSPFVESGDIGRNGKLLQGV
jgi:hypothetical protein